MKKKLNETLTDKREPIKILCEKVKLNVDKSYGFDIAATAVVAGWPPAHLQKLLHLQK